MLTAAAFTIRTCKIGVRPTIIITMRRGGNFACYRKIGFNAGIKLEHWLMLLTVDTVLLE